MLLSKRGAAAAGGLTPLGALGVVLEGDVEVEGLAALGEADSQERVLPRGGVFDAEHKVSAAVRDRFDIPAQHRGC